MVVIYVSVVAGFIGHYFMYGSIGKDVDRKKKKEEGKDVNKDSLKCNIKDNRVDN